MQQQRVIGTLRRVRPQIAVADLADYDDAVQAATDLFRQDTQLRRMLASWERDFGLRDGCVRGLRAILNGGA